MGRAAMVWLSLDRPPPSFGNWQRHGDTLRPLVTSMIRHACIETTTIAGRLGSASSLRISRSNAAGWWSRLTVNSTSTKSGAAGSCDAMQCSKKEGPVAGRAPLCKETDRLPPGEPNPRNAVATLQWYRWLLFRTV
eukprot:scaffold66413_cov60-Phaeocystis_antarctica.AAC.5